MVARRFFLDQRRGANLTEQALLELQLDTFTYQSLLAFANRVEYILNSIPVDHQPSEQTKFTWLFSRLKKCRLLQRHIDRIKDAHEGSRVRTWDWLFSKLKDLIAELREDANETAIKDALSPSSNKPNNPPKTKEQREKDRRNREKGPNCPFAHVGPGGKAPKAGAATKVDPGEGHADSEREEEIPAAKTARLIKESRYIAATGGEFPGRMLLLGQLVYYRTDPKHREKFEPSAAPALFCGYRFDSGPESFKGVYLVLDYRKVKAGTAGSDLAVSVPFEELYVPEGEEIFPMRAAFERALEGFTEPKFPDIKGLEVPFSPLSPDSTPAKRHEYITLDRIIKYGITPGCKACKGDAVIHSPVCKVRFDGLVRADKAAEARIKSLPPTPVSIPPTPLPPAPPSADPTADPAPDALDEGRDDDRGGLGAMVNKEIFVPDDEFLARDRQFRRSKAPGNNQLVEYCCSDDSEVGFTGDMYGVDCLSIGMSSIDFANPDHVDQAKGALETLLADQNPTALLHTAGPFDAEPRVLEAALEHKVPVYVDVADPMSYLDKAIAMDAVAKQANTSAVVSAGAFPGFSNILAMECVAQLRGGDAACELRDMNFAYFTAGLGGSGAVNLLITNLGFGDPVPVFRGGAYAPQRVAGAEPRRVEFFLDEADPAFEFVGERDVWSWPFPEAQLLRLLQA
ncbi:hypothetical protein AK812_SmicGene18365 [Symbiodinium microadriaticum]|uniref:Uncharacterized protein n=1 Tax=Symbiodinium microadriaticum TaxID=2951 RepID=A0A1Q9DV93_SYMMI|nr:hypothetical protein AK812_SmicGene18365 [Symbiodinium microadriaticum]